ncbi:phosphatidylinositol n-acetylglucosaminyltransferase [Cystoisospora suis]|uniref:Phosphatidylinositol n-acetylglucosaminyltransferase n=1 Tax=Cystoisospora suis TaxID=483139 RepID=A0A2C6KN71_9APIC|nr:phosphatidylinositol n-acetylglucosaminyltransferase [Cystoisospora suis]
MKRYLGRPSPLRPPSCPSCSSPHTPVSDQNPGDLFNSRPSPPCSYGSRQPKGRSGSSSSASSSPSTPSLFFPTRMFLPYDFLGASPGWIVGWIVCDERASTSQRQAVSPSSSSSSIVVASLLPPFPFSVALKFLSDCSGRETFHSPLSQLMTTEQRDEEEERIEEHEEEEEEEETEATGGSRGRVRNERKRRGEGVSKVEGKEEGEKGVEEDRSHCEKPRECRFRKSTRRRLVYSFYYSHHDRKDNKRRGPRRRKHSGEGVTFSCMNSLKLLGWWRGIENEDPPPLSLMRDTPLYDVKKHESDICCGVCTPRLVQRDGRHSSRPVSPLSLSSEKCFLHHSEEEKALIGPLSRSADSAFSSFTCSCPPAPCFTSCRHVSPYWFEVYIHPKSRLPIPLVCTPSTSPFFSVSPRHSLRPSLSFLSTHASPSAGHVALSSSPQADVKDSVQVATSLAETNLYESVRSDICMTSSSSPSTADDCTPPRPLRFFHSPTTLQVFLFRLPEHYIPDDSTINHDFYRLSRPLLYTNPSSTCRTVTSSSKSWEENGPHPRPGRCRKKGKQERRCNVYTPYRDDYRVRHVTSTRPKNEHVKSLGPTLHREEERVTGNTSTERDGEVTDEAEICLIVGEKEDEEEEDAVLGAASSTYCFSSEKTLHLLSSSLRLPYLYSEAIHQENRLDTAQKSKLFVSLLKTQKKTTFLCFLLEKFLNTSKTIISHKEPSRENIRGYSSSSSSSTKESCLDSSKRPKPMSSPSQSNPEEEEEDFLKFSPEPRNLNEHGYGSKESPTTKMKKKKDNETVIRGDASSFSSGREKEEKDRLPKEEEESSLVLDEVLLHLNHTSYVYCTIEKTLDTWKILHAHWIDRFQDKEDVEEPCGYSCWQRGEQSLYKKKMKRTWIEGDRRDSSGSCLSVLLSSACRNSSSIISEKRSYKDTLFQVLARPFRSMAFQLGLLRKNIDRKISALERQLSSVLFSSIRHVFALLAISFLLFLLLITSFVECIWTSVVLKVYRRADERLLLSKEPSDFSFLSSKLHGQNHQGQGKEKREKISPVNLRDHKEEGEETHDKKKITFLSAASVEDFLSSLSSTAACASLLRQYLLSFYIQRTFEREIREDIIVEEEKRGERYVQQNDSGVGSSFSRYNLSSPPWCSRDLFSSSKSRPDHFASLRSSFLLSQGRYVQENDGESKNELGHHDIGEDMTQDDSDRRRRSRRRKEGRGSSQKEEDGEGETTSAVGFLGKTKEEKGKKLKKKKTKKTKNTKKHSISREEDETEPSVCEGCFSLFSSYYASSAKKNEEKDDPFYERNEEKKKEGERRKSQEDVYFHLPTSSCVRTRTPIPISFSMVPLRLLIFLSKVFLNVCLGIMAPHLLSLLRSLVWSSSSDSPSSQRCPPFSSLSPLELDERGNSPHLSTSLRTRVCPDPLFSSSSSSSALLRHLFQSHWDAHYCKPLEDSDTCLIPAWFSSFSPLHDRTDLGPSKNPSSLVTKLLLSSQREERQQDREQNVSIYRSSSPLFSSFFSFISPILLYPFFPFVHLLSSLSIFVSCASSCLFYGPVPSLFSLFSEAYCRFHLEILIPQVRWLMDSPGGFKLNKHLTSILGSLILTTLHYWKEAIALLESTFFSMASSSSLSCQGLSFLVSLSQSASHVFFTSLQDVSRDLLQFSYPHENSTYTPASVDDRFSSHELNHWMKKSLSHDQSPTSSSFSFATFEDLSPNTRTGEREESPIHEDRHLHQGVHFAADHYRNSETMCLLSSSSSSLFLRVLLLSSLQNILSISQETLFSFFWSSFLSKEKVKKSSRFSLSEDSVKTRAYSLAFVAEDEEERKKHGASSPSLRAKEEEEKTRNEESTFHGFQQRVFILMKDLLKSAADVLLALLRTLKQWTAFFFSFLMKEISFLSVLHLCLSACTLLVFGVYTGQTHVPEKTAASSSSFRFFWGADIFFSFLSDLLVLSTMHIFYIYMVCARLMHTSRKCLYTLYNMFRGNKWNVLRRRVDTLEFELDHLLIGCVLFTIMICLFPTVAVFYISFTFIWIAIVFICELCRFLSVLIRRFPTGLLLVRYFYPSVFPSSLSMHILRCDEETEEEEDMYGNFVDVSELERTGRKKQIDRHRFHNPSSSVQFLSRPPFLTYISLSNHYISFTDIVYPVIKEAWKDTVASSLSPKSLFRDLVCGRIVHLNTLRRKVKNE